MNHVSEQAGRVCIVGAGPGDPDLLTLKALRLIEAADVVVYDKLVSDPIMDLIPAGATRIFAGKVARNHHMPQPDINALLVSLARSGRMVVRLKGGDPFTFGRGGEEAAFLAEHAIAYEVVPGVTSAAGCSAYAGIPLTHRDMAHGVRFATGHTRAGESLELDWPRLADPETTLVLYMGRTNIDRIAEQLTAHGLPAHTPAAAIVNGTRPQQEVLFATLQDLPARIRDFGRAAPTLLVIGRVVSLAEQLAWFRPAGDANDDTDTGTR